MDWYIVSAGTWSRQLIWDYTATAERRIGRSTSWLGKCKYRYGNSYTNFINSAFEMLQNLLSFVVSVSSAVWIINAEHDIGCVDCSWQCKLCLLDPLLRGGRLRVASNPADDLIIKRHAFPPILLSSEHKSYRGRWSQDGAMLRCTPSYSRSINRVV